MICSVLGDRIYYVTLGKGRNNDAAMLILSGVKKELLEKGQKLLGDSGYSSKVCIHPDDQFSKSWNNEQKGL
jgi:hypothetical protein